MLIDLFLADLHETFGQDDVALPRGLLELAHCSKRYEGEGITPISLRALPRTTSEAPAE